MDQTFDHDSYHPPEVRNQQQGRPITDPDLRESILAHVTRANDAWEANLTAEQQAEQRGDTYFGGASVATPEQAAAIEEAAKNATPEERAKFTARQLSGVADEASVEVPGQTPGQVPGMESYEDALKRTAEATNDTDGSASTVDSVAQRMAAAEKPTSLEASLANVRLSVERQQRIVITGDEHVRRKFYEILASRNQVFYQGGAPIITAKDRDIPKILAQAAGEVHGASVVHALQMEMGRSSPGLLGGAWSRIANVIGRKHEITVFAVGDQKQIAEKLDEVNKFVDLLQRKNVFRSGDLPRGESLLEQVQVQPAGAKAVAQAADPAHKPIELKNLASLRAVIQHPLDKVAYYQAEQQEKQSARQDFRNAKEDKAVADSLAKEREAAENGGKAPVKIHERTESLAADFDKQFIKPELMRTDTGTQQSHAQKLMYQVASIADPAQDELSTLPDASRQKFIAQMSAVLEKVADKEVDHIHKKGRPLPSEEVDKGRKDGSAPSPRERLNDFVKLELARDPAFADKLPELLRDLVDRKAITDSQATRITERVADLARDLPGKESPGASPVGATEQPEAGKAPSDTPAPASEAGAENAQASAANGAGESSAPQASNATVDVPVEQPTGAKWGSPSPSDLVSHPAPAHSDLVSAQAPDEPAQKDLPFAEVKGEQATVEVPSLEGKLAEIATLDPAKVSSDKAMSLIADLDAKQSSPLSAMGFGEGDAVTKSLARLEGFLAKAQAGDFGAEARAYAGMLSESLDRWKESHLANAMAAGTSPATHADQFDAAKAAEPKWHGQVTALGATREETPAPIEPPKAVAPASVQVTPSAESGAAPVTQADPAKEAERAEANARMAKAEVAVGMLAGMLESPANRLTHRDKSWNEAAVGQMVEKVLSLDADSVSKMSPGAVSRAAHASVWLAMSARDGKLPGFDGPEGQERATRLVKHAADLVDNLGSSLQASAVVSKQVEKAEQFVDRMNEREKQAQLAAVQSRNDVPVRDAGPSTGNESARASHDLAKDLVHIVYRGGQPTQQQIKGMLKSAGRLTPQTLKGLDAGTKAKAVTALKQLVTEVRSGGLLGEYSQLPAGMKKIVAGAQQAADTLNSGLVKEAGMGAELLKAQSELHATPDKAAGKNLDAGAGQPKTAESRASADKGSSMER